MTNTKEIPVFRAEKVEKPRNSSDDLVGKFGMEKINSLQDSIQEIEDLIAEREALSRIISFEANNIKMDITNFLTNNAAFDADGFRERNGLRQKQIEISEVELNEKVNCWRDVALLKKELRERQKELSEKQERMEFIDQIIN